MNTELLRLTLQKTLSAAVQSKIQTDFFIIMVWYLCVVCQCFSLIFCAGVSCFQDLKYRRAEL